MTNKEMIKIAMKQSAIDSNCEIEDFLSNENKVVVSKANENARRYLDLPFLCDFTSYGDNIVASASEPFLKIADNFINKYPVIRCFETPNLHWFMNEIKEFNANVCYMAEYFLPNLDSFPILECKYETRILHKEDFQKLYLPKWSNALCEERKDLDVLGIGAYDNNELIGFAGASADCKTMWQIGVDVLPNYRKQGVASAITNQLANEILKRNIVPFYCCAWSNIKSVRNALKSGFVPSWVQMTVRENDFIEKMNSGK